MTAETGQRGQDRPDWSALTDRLDRSARSHHLDKTENMTARTGQQGLDSKERTARTGHLGQDHLDRITAARQPRLDS
jgi:hypothetical protein